MTYKQLLKKMNKICPLAWKMEALMISDSIGNYDNKNDYLYILVNRTIDEMMKLDIDWYNANIEKIDRWR